MSVPTKIGLSIWNELNDLNFTYKDFKEKPEVNKLFKLINQKYVLLEDYQKEIERREKLREKYYEDWLSPEEAEELRRIIKRLCDIFDVQSPEKVLDLSLKQNRDKPSQGTDNLRPEVSSPVGVSSLPKITRVELITQKGRQYVTWKATNVQISIQDNERTLKVFMVDEK